MRRPDGSPASDALGQTLRAFLAARLAPGDRLCVGFSGGRDSTVLLHALVQLRESGFAFELAALHVHHGLSTHADDWLEFCADCCRQWHVPLAAVRIAVPRASGEGLEAAARRARYAAFAKCDSKWLALAHHRDDQAETVLQRLLRGCGVAGAAGMPAERSPGNDGPRLLRPLLALPRRALAEHARQHALCWRDDDSNADTRFARSFLRCVVLPAVEQHFPDAAGSLARAAQHFADAQALLDELAGSDRQAVAAPSGRLVVQRFNALPPARARNLLRHEWSAAGFRFPNARWIDEALRQLATAHGEARTLVRTVDGELRVYRGELYVLPPCLPAPAAASVWCGENELPWAGSSIGFLRRQGEGIRQHALASAALVLRSRRGGESFQPDPKRPHRALRKLLQEAGVPPWDRLRLPLLWCGERLVWVGGLGVDAAFACPRGEPGIVPVWPCAAAPKPYSRSILARP